VLQKGQCLPISTDGLGEQSNGLQQSNGHRTRFETQLPDVILHESHTAAGFLDGVMAMFRQFCERTVVRDDVALIAVRIHRAPQAARSDGTATERILRRRRRYSMTIT
jgi:hypothetical protein